MNRSGFQLSDSWVALYPGLGCGRAVGAQPIWAGRVDWQNASGAVSCTLLAEGIRREAVAVNLPAVPDLIGPGEQNHRKAVLFGPLGRVGAPEHGVVLEDQRGAGDVGGVADDLGGVPVVGGHDLAAVADVLEGVLGSLVDEDGVGGDALGDGEALHGLGFGEPVVGRAAGHDDVGGNPLAVLADGLEDALALLGAGCAVVVAGVAEDDERVEVSECRVGGGNGAVVLDGYGEQRGEEEYGRENTGRKPASSV